MSREQPSDLWNDPDPAKIAPALQTGKLSAEPDPRRTPLMNAHIKDVAKAMREAGLTSSPQQA